MSKLILALIAISATAADAPVITVEQKIIVREAQIAMLSNRAEIAEAESRLKDLYQQRPMLQRNFDEAILKITPPGFKMLPDLTFTRCKWAEEPGCGVETK